MKRWLTAICSSRPTTKYLVAGVVGLSVALSACTGFSGGPVEIGLDTYMLAKNGGMTFASAGELQTDLLREAAEFCHSQGKQPLLSHSGGTDSSVAKFGSANIYFRCLA